jgi:hypothetical protein
VLESQAFIETNRGRERVVGFEIEPLRAGASRLVDDCLKQPAADAGSRTSSARAGFFAKTAGLTGV